MTPVDNNPPKEIARTRLAGAIFMSVITLFVLLFFGYATISSFISHTEKIQPVTVISMCLINGLSLWLAYMTFQIFCVFIVDNEGITRRHCITGRTVHYLWTQIEEYRFTQSGLSLFLHDKKRMDLNRGAHLADYPDFRRLLLLNLRPHLERKVQKALQSDQILIKTRYNLGIAIEPWRKMLKYQKREYDLQTLKRVGVDPVRGTILLFENCEFKPLIVKDFDLFFGVLRALAPNAAFFGLSDRIPIEDTESLPAYDRWQKAREYIKIFWTNSQIHAMFYLTLIFIVTAWVPAIFTGEAQNGIERQVIMATVIAASLLFRMGMCGGHRLILIMAGVTGAMTWLVLFMISKMLEKHEPKGNFPFSLNPHLISQDSIRIALGSAVIALFIAEMGHLLSYFIKMWKKQDDSEEYLSRIKRESQE